MLEGCFKSTLRQYPKFSEDFQRHPKTYEVLKKLKNAERSFLALCDVC